MLAVPWSGSYFCRTAVPPVLCPLPGVPRCHLLPSPWGFLAGSAGSSLWGGTGWVSCSRGSCWVSAAIPHCPHPPTELPQRGVGLGPGCLAPLWPWLWTAPVLVSASVSPSPRYNPEIFLVSFLKWCETLGELRSCKRLLPCGGLL